MLDFREEALYVGLGITDIGVKKDENPEGITYKTVRVKEGNEVSVIAMKVEDFKERSINSLKGRDAKNGVGKNLRLGFKRS